MNLIKTAPRNSMTRYSFRSRETRDASSHLSVYADLENYIGEETASEEEEFSDFDETVDDFINEDAPRARNSNYRHARSSGTPFSSEMYEQIDLDYLKTQFSIPTTALPTSFSIRSTPMDYFSLFMTPNMVIELTQTTNLSIINKQSQEAIQQSQLALNSDDLSSNMSFSFNTLTVSEMYTCLGIQLFMGIVVLPHEKMYFYNSIDFMQSPLNSVLKYSKWALFKSCFTIPTIDMQDDVYKYMSHDYTILHHSTKVNWYLHHLNTNFGKYIVIGDELAIDESMGLAKCRCSSTKKMKSKPINLGTRTFMMATSRGNYCVAIVLDNKDRDISAVRDANVKIFEKLFIVCRPRNQSLVIADNYYSSLSILNMIKEKYNANYLGTLRANMIPDSVVLPSLDSFTYGVNTNNDIIDLPFSKSDQVGYTVFQCKDITEFRMITSHPLLINDDVCLHKARFNLNQLRTFGLTRNPSILYKRQLICCKEYNQSMGSVDIIDRMLELYQFKRKTAKWENAYHYYCLNLIVVNSYSLYKMNLEENDEKPMSHLSFRQQLISELIKYGQRQSIIVQDQQRARVAVIQKMETRLTDDIDWTPYLLVKSDIMDRNATVNNYRMPKWLRKEYFRFI